MIFRKSLATFLITLFFLTTFSEYCYSRGRANIRVCVASDKDRVLLRIKGPYRIEGINSALTLDKGRALKNEYIAPTNSGLKLGDREFKIYGIRIIPKKDAAIFIDKRRFRGIVHIIRTERLKLLVVNH